MQNGGFELISGSYCNLNFCEFFGFGQFLPNKSSAKIYYYEVLCFGWCRKDAFRRCLPNFLTNSF